MDKIEIIQRISQLRTRANLSARALSQKIGLNDGYISRIESKKDFLPSLDALLSIIEVCHSTPAEFFYPIFANYQKDYQIIELLNQASETKRSAILSLLQNK